MKRLVTSCFGLGWLPVAPGSWGSLPPAIIFALLSAFGTSAVIVAIIMAALALAASVVCIKFAPALIAQTGKSDPRELVADEFAGQAITFIPICAVSSSPVWLTAIIGYLLFRFFDILKPWPIRNLEKLPNGWGILADDLLAGLYACLALLVCLKLLIPRLTF